MFTEDRFWTSASELARGIDECRLRGARLINVSAAFATATATATAAAASAELTEALDLAGRHGVVVVAAGGQRGAWRRRPSSRTRPSCPSYPVTSADSPFPGGPEPVRRTARAARARCAALLPGTGRGTPGIRREQSRRRTGHGRARARLVPRSRSALRAPAVGGTGRAARDAVWCRPCWTPTVSSRK
ncbi:hypothetical protein ACFQ60_13745 [Streptomyces zhihengii]